MSDSKILCIGKYTRYPSLLEELAQKCTNWKDFSEDTYAESTTVEAWG